MTPVIVVVFRNIISRRVFVGYFDIILIVVGSSNVDIAVLQITILNNQILDHQLSLAFLFLNAGIVWVLFLFLSIFAMRRTGSLIGALVPKSIPWLSVWALLLGFFTGRHVLAIRTSSTRLNFGLMFSIGYLCLIVSQTLVFEWLWSLCVLTWWQFRAHTGSPSLLFHIVRVGALNDGVLVVFICWRFVLWDYSTIHI